MQYPQIQFYRGSLVRLASGQLKQVEDLSSDDFLESARLAANHASANQLNRTTAHQSTSSVQSPTCSSSSSSSSSSSLQFTGLITSGNNQHNLSSQIDGPRNQLSYSAAHLHQASMGRLAQFAGSSHILHRLNETNFNNNNNSVFNSPDQTSTSFDSPIMDTDECNYDYGARLADHEQHNQDDDDDIIDVELDVVSDDSSTVTKVTNRNLNLNLNLQAMNTETVATDLSSAKSITNVDVNNNNLARKSSYMSPFEGTSSAGSGDDLYIDSSVVRDFLEVGPPCSTSPASSTGSLNHQPTSSSDLTPATSSSQATITPNTTAHTATDQTVLIKFFLETSRSIAFIEVPIEHPFFVFHRGWSSWNPQRTYDKFGLKCRKLKIGDTCISLIRRRNRPKSHDCQQQQESDQCNILFSSIKIHE